VNLFAGANPTTATDIIPLYLKSRNYYHYYILTSTTSTMASEKATSNLELVLNLKE
jgi:hypothetical protein